MVATNKKIIIDYRKNGNEYIDYLICDDNGVCASISPNKWRFLNLPDTTSEYMTLKVYNRLLSDFITKGGIAKQIEFINLLKRDIIDYKNNPKKAYLYLMEK